MTFRTTSKLVTALRGAAALCLLVISTQLAASPNNFGFEDDTIGQQPVSPPWDTQAADAVAVVGTEGPGDFQVYTDKGITVSPYRGAQAVRLGTPKRVSESQNSGANSVSQTFPRTSDTLRFSFYLMSFEHRGDDSLIINVQNQNGVDLPSAIREVGQANLTISNPPRGKSVSCNTTPCELTLDAGKRKDFINTGWREVEIYNIPDASEITFSVNIQGAGNQAHASWGYVDNVNTPPEAAFTFNPGRVGTAGEGDFIVADATASTDADGDELTYTWLASGGGLPGPASTSGRTALFVFPDAPGSTPQISLTVSDGTVSSTATTGDGDIPPIDLDNIPPFIAALDAEVLSGGSGELICRFIDPGVLDTHTGDLSVTGGSLVLMPIEEENVAPFSSGRVRADYLAPTLNTGEMIREITDNSCAITDDQHTSTDEFEIRVLSQEEVVGRFEPNNSTLDATLLNAGSSYLGALETQDDIDVFEIRLADGGRLRVKSQVSVRLEVPADFDLLVLGQSASTIAGSPILASPLLASPFLASPLLASPILASPILASPLLASDAQAVPLLASPLLASPLLASPLLASPLLASPLLASGLDLTQFPLQQLSTATPDGSNISAADANWLEIGTLVAGNLANENVEIKALSAEPGTNPEHAYVEVGPGDEAIYVAISGTNGAFSSAPYTLAVEAAVPFTQAQLLGPSRCEVASPLVPAGIAKRTLDYSDGAPTSLVVVQYDRFAAIWGLTDTAETFFDQMSGYLEHSAVNARVLLLGSDGFVAGDLSPCSVAAQNQVAESVKADIQVELAATPSIENVVIVGGYDVVPPYYVIDESVVTYEGLYGADLWIKPNTPLSVAINEGYNPTDNYYVSSEPLAYRGRQLFIKDTPLGRLVETPEQILATAQSFVNQNGLIPSASALAMGYDFFVDGTNEAADVLETFASTRRVISDELNPGSEWDAETLRCEYLGEPSSSPEMCTIADVNMVNAHMSYNLAAPAKEFTTNSFLQSPDNLIRATEALGKFRGGLNISIGCHSNLNVPNNWALADAGFPADPAFDWSETGTRMGPVGFGSGDTEVANRGTEGIITLVVEELANGLTLGQAEVTAVKRYLNTLYEVDVHDEDAIVTFSLNGAPQARLQTPAAAAPVAQALSAPSANATPFGALTLDISRNGTPLPISTHAIDEVAVANGIYYTSDGEAQAIMGRPLLPVQPVPGLEFVAVNSIPDETWLHGALLLGGDYEDLIGLDPVISARARDWARAVIEQQVCVETRAPTQLAAVSTLRAGSDTRQSLIVNPAQFQCTLTPEEQSAGDTVIGDFRLFSNLRFDALSPDNGASSTIFEDFNPPTVLRQDITASTGSTEVTALLEAEDPNGVRRIVALVYTDDDGIPGGTGSVQAVEADCGDAINCARTLILPDARGKLLSFQYADAAGNVVMKSLKGLLIEAIDVNIRTRSFTTDGLTTIVVEVENIDTLPNGVLEIDYGDGNTDVFSLADFAPFDINSEGFAVITITHDYGGFAGTEVTVVATARAQGASGTASETLTRPFVCDGDETDISDDADVQECQAFVEGTAVTLDAYVQGSITDEFQYRLTLSGGASGQFKVNDLTKISTPPGVQLLEPPLAGPANRVRFSFDAADLGWDGITPISYVWETQKGTGGKKATGFVDETDPLIVEP